MPLQRSYQPPTNPPLPPQQGIFDEPATRVAINRQWAKFVISALAQLQNKERWSDDQNFAKQEIIKLIECLISGSCEDGGMTLNLRFDMTDCVLKLMHVEGESETELASVDLSVCAAGQDGREIVLATHDGNVYWRYVGETAESNRFLYPIPTNGENAPIPAVTFFDNGAVVYARFDVDGDGVHDYESPNIRGPQGAQGLPGIQGVKGDKGDKGDQGEPGEPGADAGLPWDSMVALTGTEGEPPEAFITDYYENGTNTLVLVIPRGFQGYSPELRVGIDPADDKEYIQWRLNHPVLELTWQNLIAIDDLKGEPGEQGLQGLQGEQGIQGISGVESVSAVTLAPGAAAYANYNSGTRHITFGIPSGETSSFPLLSDALTNNADANVCGGVNGMLDYIWDKYNFLLDQAELVQQGTKLIVDATVAFLEGFSFGIAEMLPLDEIVTTINDMVNIGFSTERLSVNNPDFKLNTYGNLYCRIIGTPEKALTTAIWSDWVTEDVGEMTPASPQLFQIFLNGILNHSTVKRLYHAYGADGSNLCDSLYDCDGIDDWEQIFDFKGSVSVLGFARWNPARADIQADSGGLKATGNTVSGNTTEYMISCQRALAYADATTRIDTIIIEWENLNAGNNSFASYPQFNVTLRNSAGTLIDIHPSVHTGLANGAGSQSLDFDVTKTYTTTDVLRLFFSAGGRSTTPAFNGSARITKVTVQGVGKNPFVA